MGTNREPFLKFEPQPDGAVLILFGGEWSIHRAIPAQEDLAKRLGAPSAAKSVRFDFSALQDWDSSLVSCVTAVAMRCRELKIPIATEGAPDGVDRLLKMALAVPEQNTRPAPERELFFTRLGKAGITLGAAMIEVAAFVGLCAMAFGNFLRGRAVFR